MKELIKKIKTPLENSYPQGELNAIIRIIATELLEISQTAYLLKDEIRLTAEKEAKLNDAIERLQKHEPLQYILGCTEFCGLSFKVTKDVLIPRPETQELVSWITENAKGSETILDIGTGSGCIAISIAKKLPGTSVTAWDISEPALAVARENAKANKCNIQFEKHDILTGSPVDMQFDIIVSNPPYIKNSEKKQMESNVLDWEPHTALFVPDNDPLLFYRAISEKAKNMLNTGGQLFFEINREHGAEVVSMLKEMGYQNIILRKDFADNDRIIKADK